MARRLADMLRPTLNPVAGRRAGAGAAREMEPGRFLVLAGGKVSPSRGSICGQRLSCRTVAQALQHAPPRPPRAQGPQNETLPHVFVFDASSGGVRPLPFPLPVPLLYNLFPPVVWHGCMAARPER